MSNNNNQPIEVQAREAISVRAASCKQATMDSLEITRDDVETIQKVIQKLVTILFTQS